MLRGISEKAFSQPKGKVFLQGEERLTYGELQDRIRKLTQLFIERKVDQGKWVLVSVRSAARFSEVVLALLSNGIGVNVVDPDLTLYEAQGLIKNCQPEFMIVDRELIDKWDLIGLGLRDSILFSVEDAPRKGLLGKMLGSQKKLQNVDSNRYPENISDLNGAPVEEPTDLTLNGIILNTSGTTGNPKSVMLSRKSYLNTLFRRTDKYRVSKDSKILNVLSIFAGDGFGQGPLLSFYNGCTWVRPVAFEHRSLPRILDTIYTFEVSHFIAVPVMLNLILKLPDEYLECFHQDSLKMVLSTAAELPKSLWLDFEKATGVEVSNQYGLTECSVGIYSGPDADSKRVGSIGKPYHCQTKIVDEQNCLVAQGKVGELWITSDSIMNGYLNNETATNSILSEGWLRTGDLAKVDDDGFYEIVGRAKQMINFAGHSLNPSEISEVLESHCNVEEAAVIGIDKAEWGEIPMAAVVCSDADLSQNDLLDYCRERLIEYKLPRSIAFVSQLPRTANGKISQKKLLEILSSSDSTVTGDTAEKVYQIANSCFRSDQLLKPEDNAATVSGWDSLAHMDLMVRIEKVFSFRFETREIMVVESLGQLINLVQEKTR